jgi:hypothetical protein
MSGKKGADDDQQDQDQQQQQTRTILMSLVRHDWAELACLAPHGTHPVRRPSTRGSSDAPAVVIQSISRMPNLLAQPAAPAWLRCRPWISITCSAAAWYLVRMERSRPSVGARDEDGDTPLHGDVLRCARMWSTVEYRPLFERDYED